MNEQEYEKSIAEPTAIYTKVPLDERREIASLKAEREFSRGVWEDFKVLRAKLNTCRETLGVGWIRYVGVTPIPDAPPKPEPIHPGAQRVVNAIANAIMESGRPLDRGLAEQIVATIRSWTVK